MSMGYSDDTLRERIRDNPRPALFWLAGVVILLALELGRIAGAIVEFGSMIGWVLGGLAEMPAWVSGNVAGTLGPFAGTVAFGLTVLVFVAFVAVVVNWLFVPWSLVDHVYPGAEPGRREMIERGIVTVALLVLTVLLVFTPLRGLVDAAIGALTNAIESVSTLPTLTSRETIPNQGHRLPGGGWEGTFLGLSAAWSWAIRVIVIFGYAFACLAWVWKGYDLFRKHYREADWTPRDDTINRFRNHKWGLFGFAVIFAFVVMALWAPSIGPYTAEQNLYSPYEHEVEYLDGETVTTATHGTANIQSQSQGGSQNVGPLSYDDFDRWAPIGTNQDGKDMFTFVAYGARTTLLIGLTAVGLGGAIAVILSLLTAYYKGLIDLVTIIASDTIISIPVFLLAMMLMVVFQEANHPIARVYDGGLLLGLVFAFTYWPGLWRSIRGPSLQVAEEEWVDAAKSYGQRPTMIMRKHMAPYIAAYIMIYASLILGGIIIATAALSFLGIGIQPPTPEWGRIVSGGRSFISTSSWHISTIPGIMIVLVVVGFNALGDGIRDAIDPETDIEGSEGGAGAAASGGGG